jgi:hypothetical protein
MTLPDETIRNLQEYLRSLYEQARKDGCGWRWAEVSAVGQLHSEIIRVCQRFSDDIVNENEEPTNASS